jgi:hypothetical protein
MAQRNLPTITRRRMPEVRHSDGSVVTAAPSATIEILPGLHPLLCDIGRSSGGEKEQASPLFARSVPTVAGVAPRIEAIGPMTPDAYRSYGEVEIYARGVVDFLADCPGYVACGGIHSHPSEGRRDELSDNDLRAIAHEMAHDGRSVHVEILVLEGEGEAGWEHPQLRGFVVAPIGADLRKLQVEPAKIVTVAGPQAWQARDAAREETQRLDARISDVRIELDVLTQAREKADAEAMRRAWMVDPRVAPPAKRLPSAYERDLRQHLADLESQVARVRKRASAPTVGRPRAQSPAPRTRRGRTDRVVTPEDIRRHPFLKPGDTIGPLTTDGKERR